MLDKKLIIKAQCRVCSGEIEINPDFTHIKTKKDAHIISIEVNPYCDCIKEE